MSAAAPNPLNEFEKKLKSLEPLPGGLARDRLLFEAGRRSARPSRVWPASSACLALVCVGLSVRLLLWGPSPNVSDRIASAPLTPSPPRGGVGKGLDLASARPLASPPPVGEGARNRLSIGWLQEAMVRTGGEVAIEPPSQIASRVVPARRLALVDLEADEFPQRLAPAPSSWRTWLFGGEQ